MKQNLALRIVATVLALVVAAVHLLMPELRIDSITIVLLVIAVLPWAQPLIKSIELLGVLHPGLATQRTGLGCPALRLSRVFDKRRRTGYNSIERSVES